MGSRWYRTRGGRTDRSVRPGTPRRRTDVRARACIGATGRRAAGTR
jgi:hypothetical protein